MAYHSLAVTIAVTATPQPLVALTRTPAAWVIIQARTGNMGASGLRVTAQNSAGTPQTTGGTVLNGGGSITLPFLGAPLPYNLENIYITGDANDGVDVSYGS